MDAFPSESQYQPFNSFDGLPSLGGGMLGLGAQLLMQQVAMSGGMGFAPMGVNDRNLFDRMDQLRVTMQHRELMQQAVEFNRPAFSAAALGVATQLGWGDSPALQSGINRAFNAYKAIAPVAYEIPGLASSMDSFFGRQGDMAGMTHHLFAAGRRQYDPVTGQAGWSNDTAMAVSSMLDRQLFSNGRYGGMPLQAGAVGEMYRSLSARGLAPTDFGDGAGMNPGMRDSLLRNPSVSPEIASFSGRRTAESLKQWAGAVAAVKEIFGDQGNPNAPMPQLIHMLNQLTGQSMTQINPGKLEEMVRTTKNLAANSGLGMNTALAMTLQGGAQAQAIGLDPVFGVQAAQHAMAFGAAYQGLQLGQNPIWGLGSIDQLTQLSQRRQLGFLRSHVGNRVGLAARLEDNITAGSGAANFLQAMRNGQTTFNLNGQQASTNMGEAEFIAMMAGSTGLSAGQISGMISQTRANQQPLAEDPRLASGAARLQMQDYFSSNRMGGVATGYLSAALRGVGVTDRTLAGRLSQSFVSTLRGLSTAELSDESVRNQRLTAAMSPLLAGMDPATRQQFLRNAAEYTYGGMLQQDPNLVNNLVANSDEAIRATGQEQAKAQAQGIIQSAMAPFGKGGLMSRFMQGLISGETDLTKLGAATVGVTRAKEIATALGGRVTADGKLDLTDASGPLAQALLQNRDLQSVLADVKDPDNANRGDAVNEGQERAKQLKVALAKMRRVLASQGLYDSVADATDDEINAATQMADSLTGNKKRTQKELEYYAKVVSSISQRTTGTNRKKLSELAGANEVLAASLEADDSAAGDDLNIRGLLPDPQSPQGQDDATEDASGGNDTKTVRIYINGQDQGMGSMAFGDDPQSA